MSLPSTLIKTVNSPANYIAAAAAVVVLAVAVVALVALVVLPPLKYPSFNSVDLPSPTSLPHPTETRNGHQSQRGRKD